MIQSWDETHETRKQPRSRARWSDLLWLAAALGWLLLSLRGFFHA